MAPKTTEVLQKYKTYAVVGATQNPEKYGYKIFKSLRDAGYTVYPVNPNYAEIDGVVCAPNLTTLPTPPEVVISVVPPEVTLQVIEESKSMGAQVIWMPPGAWSDETINKCLALGMNEIHEDCVITAVKLLKTDTVSCSCGQCK